MLGYHIFKDHRYSTHCEETAGDGIRQILARRGLAGARLAHLDRKVSSVHVISQEQVPGIRRVPTDFEQLHQVVLSSHKKRIRIQARISGRES